MKLKSLTWLNPVLDLMIILCFKKGGIHHPLYLFPQSKHELQAAQKDADPGNDQDGSDYDANNVGSLGIMGLDWLIITY